MSEDVLTVNAGATVLEAARLLVNAGVSAMPVVDDRSVVVGILSEADLIRHTGAMAPTDLSDVAEAARAMADARSRRIADVMTRTVVTAPEDTSLRAIAELLIKHGIKRIPIVRDNAIVGVVSRVDLLRTLISVGLDAYTQAAPAAGPADEALRVAIFTVLARHGWSAVHRSDVVISHGVVHLWGMAASDDARTAYVEAVRSVPGVRAVENHMHVGRRMRPVRG
jgi:CBS domain-containing protein